MKIKTLIISSAVAFIVFQNAFIACKKKDLPVQTQKLKIDSIVYGNGEAIKFIYENDKIAYANRYILQFPPDSQLISKIVYNYEGNKIVEKYRIYLAYNVITWKIKYAYNANGRLTSIQLLKPIVIGGVSGDIKPVSMLKINYESDRLVSSEYFEYPSDSTQPVKKAGYEYESQNGNVILALPDSIASFLDSFTYTYTNEPNFFLNDDLYIKDYPITDLDYALLNYTALLPLYLNKNSTDSVKLGGQVLGYSLKTKRNNEGFPISALLYSHSFTTPNLIRGWSFFYK
ncbi:MAG: hypothetical protein ACM3H8_16650 [Sphingobacteriales bacterium]